MKIHVPFYPLLAALLLGATMQHVFAQNPMFLSADYPFKEVQKTLHRTDYMQILFEEDNAKIAARQGNMLAIYTFDKGRLYNIVVTKTYTRAKAARAAYEGCVDYFVSTGAVAVETSEGLFERSITVSRSGKVYRLSMVHSEGDNIDVSLSSKIVNNAPRSALEGSDFIELEPDEAALSMHSADVEAED
jgi:hypothetical protein